MTISVGNRIRLTPTMQVIPGVKIQNVYDVKCETAPTGSDLDVMGDFATWFGDAYTHIHTSMASGVVAVDLRGHNVSTNTPLPTVGWGITTSPSSSADLYATGAAGLVLFRTAASRVLGRKFLGGLTEAAITDSILSIGVVFDVTDYALAIVAGPTMTLGGGSFEFGIYDKLGVFHAVASVATESVLAYQRRRRLGAGF